MDFWYFSSIQPWNNPVSNLINTQNPLHCVYLLCKHCFRDTWIHFECSLDGAVSLYLIHVTLEVPQHANRSIREQNKQNKKTPQTYFYSIYLFLYIYSFIFYSIHTPIHQRKILVCESLLGRWLIQRPSSEESCVLVFTLYIFML